MKLNKSAQLLIFLTILLCVLLFFEARIKRLNRAAAIETAKTDFTLSKLNHDTVPYDSVMAKDDTVFFYKESVFVGMSVIQMD